MISRLYSSRLGFRFYHALLHAIFERFSIENTRNRTAIPTYFLNQNVQIWPTSARTSLYKKSENLIVMSILPLLLVAVLHSSMVLADPEKIHWDSLDPAIQHILKPMESNWDQLPLGRQKKLFRGAQHWSTLEPHEKVKMRNRFTQWREMPKWRRQKIRRMFLEFQALDPEMKHEIRQQFKQFKSLSKDKRQQLRKLWKGLDAKQKKRLKKLIKQRHKRAAIRERARQRRRSRQ